MNILSEEMFVTEFQLCVTRSPHFYFLFFAAFFL